MEKDIKALRKSDEERINQLEKNKAQISNREIRNTLCELNLDEVKLEQLKKWEHKMYTADIVEVIISLDSDELKLEQIIIE